MPGGQQRGVDLVGAEQQPLQRVLRDRRDRWAEVAEPRYKPKFVVEG